MDISSLSAALASVKAATEIVKVIKDSDISLEKAESKLKLAELMSALADVKIELTEVQEDLAEKDFEIGILREQLAVKTRLEWESPYYWLSEGESKMGPFCQHCYDTTSKVIRLQGGTPSYAAGYWRCTVCKNTYKDKNYEEKPIVSRPTPRPFNRFRNY